VAINPLVVDLSHHNEVADFGKVKAAGIAAIIHKATEAIGFADKMYAVRRGGNDRTAALSAALHGRLRISLIVSGDFTRW
jgi:GH25 family lysozyme M1 (1,4-beta-N-acetylmuramidase)